MIRSLFSRLRSLIGRLLAFFVSALLKGINRIIPWHKLPAKIGALNLWVFRRDLRKYNLHDTSQIDRESAEEEQEAPPWHPCCAHARTADGTYNDLKEPKMGSAGTRFGRNFPLDKVWPEEESKLMAPSPREISRRVLARDVFKPAETLNVLAAAWIQFQNHEWFNHQRNEKEFIEIPLQEDDDWPEKSMKVERTQKDPTRRRGPSDQPPTFLSTETHWWDGSQLYGSSTAKENELRSGQDGKLKTEQVAGDERLLPDPQLPGFDLTGFNQNYWAGLALLHTLFAREHNAICDELRRAYPTWNDDHLFVTARLINGALMAKIHTVEWTPAILGHPALEIAMNANWWGLIGERITELFGRLSESEAISGIPGSPVDHHTAPYYLTEEFVSVYRLHPLIPDDYDLYSLAIDEPIIIPEALKHDPVPQERPEHQMTFTEIQGAHTRTVMDAISMADWFYSLGLAHPGAVVLHNFPRTLREFKRPDGFQLDLAAVDIMRDRERGVPRYNEFRKLLRMPRVSSFDKLTNNKQWANELEELYEGDIDRVDLMVGMYAEPPPKGFGFSDTAFRIFILMASRRLKSDRFFTDDFRPEIYTQTGMNWLRDNGMKSVLQRHFPELTPAFQNIPNAFAPWERVSKPGMKP